MHHDSYIAHSHCKNSKVVEMHGFIYMKPLKPRHCMVVLVVHYCIHWAVIYQWQSSSVSSSSHIPRYWGLGHQHSHLRETQQMETLTRSILSSFMFCWVEGVIFIVRLSVTLTSCFPLSRHSDTQSNPGGLSYTLGTPMQRHLKWPQIWSSQSTDLASGDRTQSTWLYTENTACDCPPA